MNELFIRFFLHDINLARTSVKRRVCSNLRKKLLNERTNKFYICKKTAKKVKQIEKIIKSTVPCNILAFIIQLHEDHNHVLFLLIVENRELK